MKYFYNILKIIVLIGILLLIYHQINSSGGLYAFVQAYKTGQFDAHKWMLVICFCLMPLNWLLESKKWKLLMSPHIELTFVQSLKTVLSGVAAGIVTPARLGEYGGRLVTSSPEMKTQVISATLLGSISQNFWNVTLGLCFSYFFLKTVFGVTSGEGLAFSVLIIVQICGMIWLYYNLSKVANYIQRLVGNTYSAKIKKIMTPISSYDQKLLHKVLILSLIRYCIYFGQYYLMIIFLGISLDSLTMSSNIAGIYLIQSAIPLPGFLSILARGELAIFVWSSVGVDAVIALMATFCLWFINLIIPAISGVVILFSIDLKKYFIKK